MKNLTSEFNQTYLPVKALLIYQQTTQREYDSQQDWYVESYDIGKSGRPVNAHPLTTGESITLARLLQSSADRQSAFLQSSGILPANLLYLHTGEQGFAVWYTPAAKQQLYFVKGLTIPCGMASVPAMVWKATENSLNMFALKTNKKPVETTPLYHAPYFNTDSSGKVCMGTVDINIAPGTSLQEFMTHWQTYFWESYFSHLMAEFNPVTGNIVQLWQELIGTGKPFPVGVLKKSSLTLQNLLT